MVCEVYCGKDHAWYWRVRAANHRTVLTGGEGYTRKADAVRAAKKFLRGVVLGIRVLSEGA